MRQIYKRYIVKHPTSVDSYTISGRYDTLTFYVGTDSQILFENLLLNHKIEDIDKTELYISGVRYNPTEDYEIVDGVTLRWLDSLKLVEGQRCVFVYR